MKQITKVLKKREGIGAKKRKKETALLLVVANKQVDSVRAGMGLYIYMCFPLLYTNTHTKFAASIIGWPGGSAGLHDFRGLRLGEKHQPNNNRVANDNRPNQSTLPREAHFSYPLIKKIILPFFSPF